MRKSSEEVRKHRCARIIDVHNEEMLRGDYAKNISDKTNYSAKDEYYTQRYQVEEVFQIIDTQQLRGKTLYCPCDDDQSEFTKYINEHKDEWGLKEFIHTSDDFNTHEDLFTKADYVVTNPPFSKIKKELIPMLLKTNTKYFLFGSALDMSLYEDKDNTLTFFPTICHKNVFDTPHKESTKEINYVLYLTNMKIADSLKDIHNDKYMKTFKHKTLKDITLYAEINGEKFPAIDYCRDFPQDFEGWVVCPVQMLIFKDLYEIQMMDYMFTKPIDLKYSDGNGRYLRVMAKKKADLTR